MKYQVQESISKSGEKELHLNSESVQSCLTQKRRDFNKNSRYRCLSIDNDNYNIYAQSIRKELQSTLWRGG